MRYDDVAEVMKAVREIAEEGTEDVMIINTRNTLHYLRCKEIQDIEMMQFLSSVLIDIRQGPKITFPATDIKRIRLQDSIGRTLGTWPSLAFEEEME